MNTKRDAASVIWSSLIFLFFFELLTKMIAAIYNLNLLQVNLNENVAGKAFLLSPELLIFVRRTGKQEVRILGSTGKLNSSTVLEVNYLRRAKPSNPGHSSL